MTSPSDLDPNSGTKNYNLRADFAAPTREGAKDEGVKNQTIAMLEIIGRKTETPLGAH